jgi:hypothetical protein
MMRMLAELQQRQSVRFFDEADETPDKVTLTPDTRNDARPLEFVARKLEFASRCPNSNLPNRILRKSNSG